MAPAHITMFLFQKPSTENGIIRPGCNFIISVDYPRLLELNPQLVHRVHQHERESLPRLGLTFCGENGVSVDTSRSKKPANLQYTPRVDILQHCGVRAANYG